MSHARKQALIVSGGFELMPRKCFICKTKSDVINMFIDGLKATCRTADCMTAYSLWKLEKQKVDRDKSERKELRKKKEKLNETVPYWTKKAQVQFNKFIRLRDCDLPCISCPKEAKSRALTLRGSIFDCGHYRSVGSCPSLRFDELNAHKQCVSCNQYKSGNVVEYRINLKNKIGPDNLDWLEGPHEPKRYRVQDLKDIYSKYKNKVKEIEDN